MKIIVELKRWWLFVVAIFALAIGASNSFHIATKLYWSSQTGPCYYEPLDLVRIPEIMLSVGVGIILLVIAGILLKAWLEYREGDDVL